MLRSEGRQERPRPVVPDPDFRKGGVGRNPEPSRPLPEAPQQRPPERQQPEQER